MRFEIHATIDVPDPAKLLEVSRRHCELQGNHAPAEMTVEEFIPAATDAAAQAINYLFDFTEAASLIYEVGYGSRDADAFADVFRALAGRVTVTASAPGMPDATYHTGS